MASPFSRVFAELRARAGFETAYQFFHKNGGRRAFGCSFQNYLRIEKGSHLPKPERLPHLCRLLRLPLGSEDLRRIVGAYLETWLRGKELADWVLAPFRAPAAPSGPLGPGQKALARLVQEGARPVSLEQYEAVMSSAGAYWCFRVLTTSRLPHSLAELEGLLGLPAAEVSKGLSALKRCGIAKARKDGRWQSPLAGRFLVFPDSGLIPEKTMRRVFDYNAAMVKRRGRLVDVRYCGVRADSRQLEGFIPYFREAIRGVNAYAVSEKTEESALFFVEGRVYKLLDF